MPISFLEQETMIIKSKGADQSGSPCPHRYFLITSTGACATRWLGATLSRHPQIVCSSGVGELSFTLNYEAKPPEVGNASEAELTAIYLKNHFVNDSAESRTLDSLFDDLEQARPATYYGNVHHETVATLRNNLHSHGSELRRSIRVANLIRHPIPRIAAKARIIQTQQAESQGMMEVYRMQFDARVGQYESIVAEIGDQIGDFEENPIQKTFVNAVLDTLDGLDDFRTPGLSEAIPHFCIERIKTEPDQFLDLMTYITGGALAVDSTYLDWVFSDAHSNEKRFSIGPTGKRPPESPLEQWEAWEDWQRRVFQVAMIRASLRPDYEAHGYDFSFVKDLPPPQHPGRGNRYVRSRKPAIIAPALFNQMR